MSTMQGKHIDIWRKVLIASAASGQHSLIQSPPGYGKSRVARAAMEMFEPSERIFLRLSSSTPPEKVEGMLDPAAAIKSPPEFIVSRKGTAFDPLARVVLMDEIGRANDAVFDILLDALDRIDLAESCRPVVFATTNFMNIGQRTEAIADRIAFWVLEKPALHAVKNMVFSIIGDLSSELDIGGLPTVDEIRSARRATATNKSKTAVADTIESIVTEATKQSMEVNPRHIDQWTRILFRVSTLYYGSNDWTQVHKEANFVMKYAYVILDSETKAKWEQVVGCSVDVIGSAIDAVLLQGIEEIDKLATATSVQERMEVASKIGDILARKKNELTTVGGTDPRVDEALNQLAKKFREVVAG